MGTLALTTVAVRATDGDGRQCNIRFVRHVASSVCVNAAVEINLLDYNVVVYVADSLFVAVRQRTAT